MKPKTAIVMILVLLAVVGLVIVQQGKRRQQQAEPPAPPVVDKPDWPELGRVVEVTIVPAEGADDNDDKKIRFVKVGKDWRIAEPIDTRAWAYMVDEIAQIIKDFPYERSFVAGEAGAPAEKLTGLVKPKWIVTVRDDKDVSRSVEIGAPVPLTGGQKTYVRPAGDKRTYVSALNFAERFTRPTMEYRNRLLVEILTESIQRVRIEGRELVELAKSDGKWQLTLPAKAPADLKQVNNLLRKLARFKAKKFIDDAPEDLAVYGLALGQERLIVRFWAEPEPATETAATAPAGKTAPKLSSYGIALGGQKHTEGERYAKMLDSPGVFLVRVSLIDSLQPTALSLREKTIMPMLAQRVVRLELELPDRKAEFVREGNAWRMVTPYEGPAHNAAVNHLLQMIGQLKAESFRDDVTVLQSVGLAPPAGRIVIHEVGKKDTQILLLGGKSPSGEMMFLRRADANAVAVVRAADVEELLTDPVKYYNPNIFEMPVGQSVETMTVTRDGRKFALRRQDGKWTMSEPVASGVDQENVNAILDQLDSIEATQIVSLEDKLPIKYAVATKRITIEFDALAQPPAATTAPATQPKPEPDRYVLNVAKIGLGVFAWIEGVRPVAVGEFHATFFDKLSAELRDRAVWKIQPKEIVAIRITTGEDVIELKRTDGVWKYLADPYVKISDKKVLSFVESVEEFSADRFAYHAIPDDPGVLKYGLNEPWLVLALTDSAGKLHRITISQKGPRSTRTRYAIVDGTPGVIVLSSDTAGRMAKGLADFKE